MNLVQDKTEKSDASFRKSVLLEKQVAVALWQLATGNLYRITSKDFVSSLPTVAKIIYEFFEAILKISHAFIHFLTSSRETAIAIQKFRVFSESNISQVFGVNNRTHIEILCVDSESRVDHFSRKQRYITNTQAVVGVLCFCI